MLSWEVYAGALKQKNLHAMLSEDGYRATANLNSVALVHKRTIPTERPPLVGEVNANICG
jgi:hypothetical protein